MEILNIKIDDARTLPNHWNLIITTFLHIEVLDRIISQQARMAQFLRRILEKYITCFSKINHWACCLKIKNRDIGLNFYSIFLMRRKFALYIRFLWKIGQGAWCGKSKKPCFIKVYEGLDDIWWFNHCSLASAVHLTKY